MNGDDVGRPRGPDPRRARRSCRPLWLGGVPEPERGPDATGGDLDASGSTGEPGGDRFDCSGSGDGAAHDPATCEECAAGLEGLDGLLAADAPEPDLGEIVVILLVSTLTGLRDRLERDGFDSAAALVHDLVEVADDYVMRFQP